jgi:hypothetical protein
MIIKCAFSCANSSECLHSPHVFRLFFWHCSFCLCSSATYRDAALRDFCHQVDRAVNTASDRIQQFKIVSNTHFIPDINLFIVANNEECRIVPNKFVCSSNCLPPPQKKTLPLAWTTEHCRQQKPFMFSLFLLPFVFV